MRSQLYDIWQLYQLLDGEMITQYFADDVKMLLEVAETVTDTDSLATKPPAAAATRFKCFEAAHRVETKLNHDCWGVVFQFLIGSYAVIDEGMMLER